MSRRRQQQPFPIGALSSGSFHMEDLLNAASEGLKTLIDFGYATQHELQTLIDDAEGVDSDDDDAADVLDDVVRAIEEHTPPYVYYGGHEGDPTDVGFWISWESVEDDRRSGELMEYDDVTPSYSGLAIDVNDHGNATLYDVKRGKAVKTIWEVV